MNLESFWLKLKKKETVDVVLIFLTFAFFHSCKNCIHCSHDEKKISFFYQGAFRTCFIYFTKGNVNMIFIWNHSFEISNIIYINTWQGNILNRKNRWINIEFSNVSSQFFHYAIKENWCLVIFELRLFVFVNLFAYIFCCVQTANHFSCQKYQRIRKKVTQKSGAGR